MMQILCKGIHDKRPYAPHDSDEIYIVAVHKGSTGAVKNKAEKAQSSQRGEGGVARLKKRNPPVPGLIQRGGDVVLSMVDTVKQETREPVIHTSVVSNTLIYTDAYDICGRLTEWGYGHKTMYHGKGEYARDEDGNGFCEVQVNTIEGFWSLLRSWVRLHGDFPGKAPFYLGFLSILIM